MCASMTLFTFYGFESIMRFCTLWICTLYFLFFTKPNVFWSNLYAKNCLLNFSNDISFVFMLNAVFSVNAQFLTSIHVFHGEFQNILTFSTESEAYFIGNIALFHDRTFLEHFSIHLGGMYKNLCVFACKIILFSYFTIIIPRIGKLHTIRFRPINQPFHWNAKKNINSIFICHNAKFDSPLENQQLEREEDRTQFWVHN